MATRLLAHLQYEYRRAHKSQKVRRKAEEAFKTACFVIENSLVYINNLSELNEELEQAVLVLRIRTTNVNYRSLLEAMQRRSAELQHEASLLDDETIAVGPGGQAGTYNLLFHNPSKGEDNQVISLGLERKRRKKK